MPDIRSCLGKAWNDRFGGGLLFCRRYEHNYEFTDNRSVFTGTFRSGNNILPDLLTDRESCQTPMGWPPKQWLRHWLTRKTISLILSEPQIPKTWFLTHMAIIKDKKWALEMAWRRSSEESIHENLQFLQHGGQHGIPKSSYLGLEAVSQTENLTQC